MLCTYPHSLYIFSNLDLSSEHRWVTTHAQANITMPACRTRQTAMSGHIRPSLTALDVLCSRSLAHIHSPTLLRPLTPAIRTPHYTDDPESSAHGIISSPNGMIVAAKADEGTECIEAAFARPGHAKYGFRVF